MKTQTILIAVSLFATSAYAEFKADLKSNVKAGGVHQLSVAVGQSAIAQAGIASINVTGIKHGAIKMRTGVRAGTLVQAAIAVSGYNQVNQSNIAGVNVAVPR
jgi:hypothetical protein